jgi:hypothetical protein
MLHKEMERGSVRADRREERDFIEILIHANISNPCNSNGFASFHAAAQSKRSCLKTEVWE